jgi:hypothetical protein
VAKVVPQPRGANDNEAPISPPPGAFAPNWHMLSNAQRKEIKEFVKDMAEVDNFARNQF